MIVRFALHPSHLRLRAALERVIIHLDFFPFQRLHRSPDNSCARMQNMDGRCMTQTELAERWQISEATLERWRTEAGGPVFLKLGAQVRYRLRDVEAFEAEVLRESTKSDGGPQHQIVDQPKRQLKTTIRPARPITIWLYAGPRRTRLRPGFAGRTR